MRNPFYIRAPASHFTKIHARGHAIFFAISHQQKLAVRSFIICSNYCELFSVYIPHGSNDLQIAAQRFMSAFKLNSTWMCSFAEHDQAPCFTHCLWEDYNA